MECNVVTFSREISFKFENKFLNLLKLVHSWYLFFRLIMQTIRCQFHQHFTHSFYTHWSHKRKKIQLGHQYLFALLGSAFVKASSKHFDEINPWCQREIKFAKKDFSDHDVGKQRIDWKLWREWEVSNRKWS